MADMKKLCCRFLAEREAFQKEKGYLPVFSELSADLQDAIKEVASPVILAQGTSALEAYLKAF